MSIWQEIGYGLLIVGAAALIVMWGAGVTLIGITIWDLISEIRYLERKDRERE